MFPVQKEREAVELDFSGNYIGGRECDYLVCVLSRADNIEILVCTSVCVCVCMCMCVCVCVCVWGCGCRCVGVGVCEVN